MEILTRDFYNCTRQSEYVLYAFGDTHNGVKPSREDKLRILVREIASQDNAYWLFLGDACDFINRSDPRFSPEILADWIELSDLADLARAQRDRFVEVVKPIAPKCLGIVQGNHEVVIKKRYERDIYLEIVSAIKQLGGFKDDHRLAFGFTGWLILNFYRSSGKDRSRRIIVSLHHGYTGGKLGGAKALNMERWLWTHECDLALMGHSHNCDVYTKRVDKLDTGGNFCGQNSQGAFCGTFLDTTMPGIDTYSAIRGYLPLPVSYIKIVLRPHSHSRQQVEVIPQFPT